jgi:hypothetical protein
VRRYPRLDRERAGLCQAGRGTTVDVPLAGQPVLSRGAACDDARWPDRDAARASVRPVSVRGACAHGYARSAGSPAALASTRRRGLAARSRRLGV